MALAEAINFGFGAEATGQVMSDPHTQTSRRQFFRGTGLAGVSTLAGLGLDLKPAPGCCCQAEDPGGSRRSRASALTARSDAPRSSASATGRSSTSRGIRIARSTAARSAPRARPRFSSRSTRTGSPRSSTAPRSRRNGKRSRSTGPWTGSPSSSRRRATPTSSETWEGQGPRRQAEFEKRVNHCATIASLGGATMDNEWNYVQLKLWRALGLIWLENQARI